MSMTTRWEKSSYSMNNANCVECAARPSGAAVAALVRDTQNRAGGHLEFTGPEWGAAVAALVRPTTH